jgi:hypothetical protein
MYNIIFHLAWSAVVRHHLDKQPLFKTAILMGFETKKQSRLREI